MKHLTDDLDNAIENIVQERMKSYGVLWLEYQSEIKILSEALECSPMKQEKFLNKVKSLPKRNDLENRIITITASNTALVEECDYLRNQLRLEDRDFYDNRDNNIIINQNPEETYE